MKKGKVISKQEKRYGELKKELEMVTLECKRQEIQSDKPVYLEKLAYSIEVLDEMDKIKKLSHSNRIGLKFIKETHAMLSRSLSKTTLVRAINPFRIRRYHKMSVNAGRKDKKEGNSPDGD